MITLVFYFHRRQNFCMEQVGALICGQLPETKRPVFLIGIHASNGIACLVETGVDNFQSLWDIAVA